MTHDIEVIRFSSQVEYAEAMRLQRERRIAIAADRAPNALYLLEHAPVITLGRRGNKENILCNDRELQTRGVKLYEADRGGDVTYHGPGQLIAYPVLNLTQWRESISWYLRALEEVVIRSLKAYGVQGERLPEFTGVWIDGAKISAVGVGIRQWITFHGASINVAPNMDHFRLIIPCGIADKPITALNQLLRPCPSIADVMDTFEEQFRIVFEAETECAP